MSHLIIRKRTESLRAKLHSQQSINAAPRRSIGRILNDNIAKRRFATTNSPDHSVTDAGTMQAEIGQAKQLFETKNTKCALLAFKKLSKKYPKNSEIPYFIGSCLLNEGNFEQALFYFRTCLMLDSSFNKNVFIFMSISLKAQGKFKEAIHVLEQACTKYPRFKDALFYKGKLHLHLAEYNNACICFKKCIKIDPNDDQAKLLLADSLAGCLNLQSALQLYNEIIQANGKLKGRAKSKRICILVQLKRFKDAIQQLNQCDSHSAELIFMKGICQYELQNYNDAITCFELTLTSNIPEPSIKRGLKYLIQIRIKEKDFFAAEHLISRAKFVANGQEQLSLYYKLVQGINDLIKKRLTECQQKLQFVYNSSKKQATDSAKFLYQACIPYLAFCLFAMEKYEKSLQFYKMLSKVQPRNKLDHYNISICAGVVQHKKGQYTLAESKFRQAAQIINTKAEPLFLICVNSVQENKDRLIQTQVKQTVIDKLQKQFKCSKSIQTKNSLFLFYQSLVLLYLGKDATDVIDQAIKTSQQEVSEYFFIQALAYSLAGQTIKGLQSISKAIELDQSIPEFFKERSKYYYVLGRYDEAVSDVVRIMEETQDEESKLLLTFYYYMVNEYGLSFQLLQDISQQCSEDKFKQFQAALYFRLHRYDKCGEVGRIINAIINKQQIGEQVLANFVEQHINQRFTYSQFSIYFYHINLAAYFFYSQQFDNCLEHLFGALQEIQIASESQQCFAAISETLLNQIKFDIALTSLQKQIKDKQGKIDSLSDSCKYIEMFITETEDPEFISIMSLILKLLQAPLPHRKQTSGIQLFNCTPKLSDDFPVTNICLSSEITIKTKFVIMYPQKLKFNISPEFDESFLFNFDIDKIESKLCPPWFKLHEGQVIFTDKIRNESVMISETEKAPTPALVTPSTPIVRSLKEKFKLDQQIEKKLQRIIRKNGEKAKE